MVTTRRHAASTAEPSQSASEQGSQRESSPVEPPRKRGRKAKVPVAQAESQSVVESHAESYTKSRTTSRAASSSAATATATTMTTSTAATVSKRVTRAAREAGHFSPLRVLSEPQPQPKRQTDKKHKQKRRVEHADSDPEPEPAHSAPAQDENDSESGMFFTKSEHNISSPPPQNTLTALTELDELSLLRNQHAEAIAFALDLQQRLAHSERLRAEAENRLAESERLGAEAKHRLAESEKLRVKAEHGCAVNTTFCIQAGRSVFKLERSMAERDVEISKLRNKYESPLQHLQHLDDSLLPPCSSPQTQSQQCSRTSTPSHYLPLHRTQQTSPSRQTRDIDSDMNDANIQPTEFDSDMMGIDDEPAAEPIFISGTKKALDLLHKIENNAAKESTCVKRSHDNSECGSDDGDSPKMRSIRSPRHSISNELITPARAIASPSGFFSKSLSMLKAKFGFVASTPLPPPSPTRTPKPTPQPLPPFTEILSIPLTPEPTNTPARKRNGHSLLRTLLRGVTGADITKARQWAKPIVQQLRTDPAFRDKRKRLETPVLAKDLKFYPSSKPWENGFGDPLFEFDDEDVVPVWAVYLSIVAEEDKHRTKRRRSNQSILGDFEMSGGSLNEQYATAMAAATVADSNARSAPGLYNSHGNSASLHDLHPRRSTEPSPLFDTPVVHQEGDNVFREAKGYDTTAKIRENDLETLQQQTKQTVSTHNPTMGSFSVPDGSDEEDTSMTSETSDNNGAPLWTQPPPPAPVPAHAPLPGGSLADAPSVPAVQQPVDEVERQRQKLMKHTPAKPSRLREATYPSPSILTDAGNESVLAGTPGQLTGASLASILDSMPGAEPLDIDEEDLQAAAALQASSEWKAAAAAWSAPILTYDSEEEGVSPV